MNARIGIIHATPNAIAPMKESLKKFAGKVQSLHFLDEGIIEGVNKSGTVTAPLLKRLLQLIEKAEESKVDGVVLSCSSFTPYIEKIEPYFNFPVVSVDYAMLEKAVKIGKHIGVVATVAAAGPTTTKIIKDIAQQRKKEINVYTETITEATEALLEGKVHTHDVLIRQKIQELSEKCDVVVIAQLSMIRALEDFHSPVPILTGGETSIENLVEQLDFLNNREKENEIHELI